MARYREEVGFGAADAFMFPHAEEAQENFLREVGNVVRVSHARGQEATQSLAVAGRDFSYERSGVGWQGERSCLDGAGRSRTGL